MRNLQDRLQDILDAIAQIEIEQAKGKAAFEASQLVASSQRTVGVFESFSGDNPGLSTAR